MKSAGDRRRFQYLVEPKADNALEFEWRFAVDPDNDDTDWTTNKLLFQMLPDKEHKAHIQRLLSWLMEREAASNKKVNDQKQAFDDMQKELVQLQEHTARTSHEEKEKEAELYQKFCLVLDRKKRKIAELQSTIEELEAQLVHVKAESGSINSQDGSPKRKRAVHTRTNDNDRDFGKGNVDNDDEDDNDNDDDDDDDDIDDDDSIRRNVNDNRGGNAESKKKTAKTQRGGSSKRLVKEDSMSLPNALANALPITVGKTRKRIRPKPVQEPLAEQVVAPVKRTVRTPSESLTIPSPGAIGGSSVASSRKSTASISLGKKSSSGSSAKKKKNSSAAAAALSADADAMDLIEDMG